MTSDTDLVEESLQAPRARALAEEIVSAAVPSAVLQTLRDACLSVTGRPPARLLRISISSSIAASVQLADGERVFVKLHRPSRSQAFLAAVQHVQKALCDEGFPAPRPFGTPLPAMLGYATVEEWLPGEPPVDVRDPVAVDAMATGLCELVARATTAGEGLPLPPAGVDGARNESLWPPANSPVVQYDSAALTGKSEWIDAFGAEALARRPAGEAVCVGHLDWRKDNVALTHDRRLAAVFDWDSLARARETTIVAIAAGFFSGSDTLRYPTPPEAWAFVRAYQAARREKFSVAETAAIGATMAWSVAWSARMELSDSTKGGRWGPDQQRLADYGAAYFAPVD